MKRLFDENYRLQKLLDVETALAEAQAQLGILPSAEAVKIRVAASKAKFKSAGLKALEARLRHDIMALITALEDEAGSRFVHFGATSNDILDTATALQLKAAIKIIETDLVVLQKILARLARKYRTALMLGRTHGQAALPITFGLKMAVFAAEIGRHLERLKEIEKRVCVGKMTGAVGTGAGFGDKALELQTLVMKKLGLGTEEGPTQIVARDRYAELICFLAIVASTAEKFATELRNLQRTEIDEVREKFSAQQVGSSTMAHKRNPVMAENICGLARIVRALAPVAMENMLLWHERDLTNSSAERVLIPHVCILIDDILMKLTELFAGLEVRTEKMKENIARTRGLMMAEAVMLTLIRKGLRRQEAHELIRKCALEADRNKLEFKAVLLKNKKVSALLTERELDRILNPNNYLGATEKIIENIISKIPV